MRRSGKILILNKIIKKGSSKTFPMSAAPMSRSTKRAYFRLCPEKKRRKKEFVHLRVNLLGLLCRFNKAAAYRPQEDSSGLVIHSHRFDCNWLELMCLCKSSVFTAFVLLGAVCSCASFHR